MLDNTNLKIQVIQNLEQNNWLELCGILEERFHVNSNEKRSINITPDVIVFIGKLLNKIITLLSTDDNNFCKVIKQICKALRNSVAYNSDAQMFITDFPSILKDIDRALKILIATDKDNEDCIKMLLQFLINLVVNNVPVTSTVWHIFGSDVKKLIKNNICLYHSSALTYNIVHNKISLLEQDPEIITHIFDSYKQNNEYLTFLLELFIKNVNLNKKYTDYIPEHRILCLEMMREMFNDDQTWMTEELLNILITEFKQKSDCVLKTVTNYLKHIEPFEVTTILEVLCVVSSNESFVHRMQVDTSLLINCAFLLKSIHSAGRLSQNNFSPIPNLSQLENTELEMFEHPAYGFKASIIRLLANLCWRHRKNQDQARELECIPLLLDCCNIDARNPFIIQWVIFAIRNLCENNIENQGFIAAMNNEGVISSAALMEMGITLHSDDENLLRIVPLDFNK